MKKQVGPAAAPILLRSHLSSDVWLEGAANEESTVEVATRDAVGVSRRVRVRRYSDGGLEVRTVNAPLPGERPQPRMQSIIGRIADTAGNLLFIGALALALGTITGFATVHVVASGSMVPSLKVGDLVFAVSDDVVPPAMGDVVIFKGTKLSGEAIGPFAHRIIGGNAASGWITKGDANTSPDTFQSTSTEIMGRVLFSVPGVGLLLEPRTLLLLLGGLVVFLLFR